MTNHQSNIFREVVRLSDPHDVKAKKVDKIQNCVLCFRQVDFLGQANKARCFMHCTCCGLIFADPQSHLDQIAEKQRYDLHQNCSDDSNYRAFLNQLAGPLLLKLKPGMQGLDYGSGPGPTLSWMFEQAGMQMSIYDPYYAPDQSVLKQTFDFVTCSEVVEHFYNPSFEWQRLVSLVRPGGWIGVMTMLVDESRDFFSWHYQKDPTHVSFYSEATVNWIARKYQLELEILSGRVFMLSKK